MYQTEFTPRFVEIILCTSFYRENGANNLIKFKQERLITAKVLILHVTSSGMQTKFQYFPLARIHIKRSAFHTQTQQKHAECWKNNHNKRVGYLTKLFTHAAFKPAAMFCAPRA